MSKHATRTASLRRINKRRLDATQKQAEPDKVKQYKKNTHKRRTPRTQSTLHKRQRLTTPNHAEPHQNQTRPNTTHVLTIATLHNCLNIAKQQTQLIICARSWATTLTCKLWIMDDVGGRGVVPKQVRPRHAVPKVPKPLERCI